MIPKFPNEINPIILIIAREIFISLVILSFYLIWDYILVTILAFLIYVSIDFLKEIIPNIIMNFLQTIS